MSEAEREVILTIMAMVMGAAIPLTLFVPYALPLALLSMPLILLLGVQVAFIARSPWFVEVLIGGAYLGGGWIVWRKLRREHYRQLLLRWGKGVKKWN